MPIQFFFVLIFVFLGFFFLVFIWQCQVLIVVLRILDLRCNMWNLFN